MQDYDLVGTNWLPYVMYFNRPDLRSEVVNTDAHGFRHTTIEDRTTQLDYESFRGRSGPESHVVLLGSSAAFGVGASGDEHTIPSVMTANPDVRCFNYGGRAFNSTQEAILFFLHLPSSIDHLVIFSGVNNLVLSFMAPRTSPVYNSMFLQSQFERAMELEPGRTLGVKRRARELWREIKHKVAPPTKLEASSPERKYADVVDVFRRDLLAMKGLGDAFGFAVTFVLQPVATWIDKELSSEETQLFEILDTAEGDQWQALRDFIGAEREQYARDLHGICRDSGVPFVNLNESIGFSRPEWLFVDRVHLTDAGYSLAASVIARELEL